MAAVLALWERAGVGRPRLRRRAEVRAQPRRDRALSLGATERSAAVGAAIGADDRRGWVRHLAVEPERQSAGIRRARLAEPGRRLARRGTARANRRADRLGASGCSERLGKRDERRTSLARWLRPPER